MTDMVSFHTCYELYREFVGGAGEQACGRRPQHPTLGEMEGFPYCFMEINPR